MKKFILLVVSLFFIVSCGGVDDTSSDSSQSVPLPNIIDNFTDGIFIYSDPAFYRGTYDKTDIITDTCSTMFGRSQPSTIEIIAIDSNSMIFSYNGIQETIYGMTFDGDTYYYKADYITYGCDYGIASSNANGQTRDFGIVYCDDYYTTASCQTAYDRASSYDFTSTNIK